MKENRTLLLIAFLSTFIVYLDITLKYILKVAKLAYASGDNWWLILLVVTCLFNWLVYLSGETNKKLIVFTLFLQLLPVILFIVFLFNKDNYPASRSISIAYIISELLLFIPIHLVYINILLKNNKS